jgi:hypothetical protein
MFAPIIFCNSLTFNTCIVMKKCLIAFICLITISLSCKKNSSSTPTYYFQCTLDGVAKTFNVNSKAIILNMAGIQSLSLIGNVTSAANLEGLNITVNNSPSPTKKQVVAGSYSEQQSTDFVLGAVYNPGSATEVYGAGVFPGSNPFQLVITSMDANTIKGTFSGNLYYQNDVTGTIGPNFKVVTNGQFYLHF